MKKIFYIFCLLAAMVTMSQTANAKPDDTENKTEEAQWAPSAVWPFVYREFLDATIITKASKIVKAKANIHVGNMYVWYESKGQKLEVKRDLVKKVIFPNGDIYYPVLARVVEKRVPVMRDKLCRVVREDTINGKIGRLLVSEELDRNRYEELVKANRQAQMGFGDGLMSSVNSMVSANEILNDVEQNPLPMRDKYYMEYNDEIFEANESEITKRMEKSERAAYRAYERSAEILAGNRSSMENVWITFFVSKNKAKKDND
ncbi:MAG: hypothetical protein KBT34_15035 [Prevotella sp.]|nr:hypothetical protein [Candidatus Prevotella equi]